MGCRPLTGGGWRAVGPIDIPESVLISRGAKVTDDLRGIVLSRIENVFADSELGAELWRAEPAAPPPERLRAHGVDFEVREGEQEGLPVWFAVGRVAYVPFDHTRLVRATEKRDWAEQRVQRHARDGVEVRVWCERKGALTDADRAELVAAIEQAFASQPWPESARG
jgi:hypothetical protein